MLPVLSRLFGHLIIAIWGLKQGDMLAVVASNCCKQGNCSKSFGGHSQIGSFCSDLFWGDSVFEVRGYEEGELLFILILGFGSDGQMLSNHAQHVWGLDCQNLFSKVVIFPQTCSVSIRCFLFGSQTGKVLKARCFGGDFLLLRYHPLGLVVKPRALCFSYVCFTSFFFLRYHPLGLVVKPRALCFSYVCFTSFCLLRYHPLGLVVKPRALCFRTSASWVFLLRYHPLGLVVKPRALCFCTSASWQCTVSRQVPAVAATLTPIALHCATKELRPLFLGGNDLAP